MPANMIGWIVRVFSYGFAYQLTEEGWQGHVSGRVGFLKQKNFLAFAMKRFSLAGLLRRRLTQRMHMKRPLRLLTLYLIYNLLGS